MKKILILSLIVFIIIGLIYIRKNFLNLENEIILLNKKVSICKQKSNGYKNEGIEYRNGYLLLENNFFKNYDENIKKFKNYLKNIGKDCKTKKVCINILELDISFSKNNDIEKFLNDFLLKNVYKLRISIANVDKKLIKDFFKNLNYKNLKYLHLDINDIQGEDLVGYIKDLINDKKNIDLLQILTIENVGKDKLNNTDILNLSKLKVNTIEFLGYPISLKDILKLLKKSKYLYKINISDGINYNGKKAFYFIKRNGKIYIYDNLGKELN